MDSDSSLDGEFESKHEVAVRRNSTAAQSESDGEVNDESDLSSTDSEDEKNESADPSRRDSSPQSNDGDGSDSDASKHSASPAHYTPQSPSSDRENWSRSVDRDEPPNSTCRISSPGLDQEKLSPSSNVRRHSFSSEDEKHTPSSGEGKCSPNSRTGKLSSTLDAGKHSPSSDIDRHSPSSNFGKRSPNSDVEKHSTSSDVEKQSLGLEAGPHSPIPDHPRSPSFHDEHSVHSPDPGDHVGSDHENRSRIFYGRVRSPGDRSPSTDYGKQSPSSGRVRWTPSPDRGTRSPKLLGGSELGEESAGSCSGIRSPSLNGDTRSSRAWSPSPERDKHFRLAGQEARSKPAGVPDVQSSVPDDSDNEKLILKTESEVLMFNRDGGNQSPKLSHKVPSPKSNRFELLLVTDHAENSVKSSRILSPDSNYGKASSTTKENVSIAGPTSPNSNDDGELSDSSQEAGESAQQSKSVMVAGDGEKAKDKSQANSEVDKVQKKNNITSHGEDLSDVSDLESNVGAESLGELSEDDRGKKSSTGGPPAQDVEQLDFEAEEREEGECEAREDGKSEDEGELKGDELEEGELTDDDENRPEETEPRPVCRFYSRGHCTWGPNCRFLHPGVTDKGNYTMFDMVRPLVTVNGPPMYPMEYRVPVPVPVPYEKPAPAIPYQGPRKEEPPVFESAWERGLRQAKEMMRKSTKRKEMDMDFEEKKMNLSLGQEELDKENDYYTRQASPIKEETERWSSYDRLKAAEPDGKYGREGSVFEEYPSDHPYYHQHGRSEYWRRVQYEPSGDARSTARMESSDYRTSSKYRRSPSDHYYDKYDKKKKSSSSHSTREVIMQRVEKPWRDERYAEVTTASSHRGRGDEWADPWMRSKSPTSRKGTSSRPARKSYSSGSSYSSSSSSRSSSRSSYSSYSRDSHSRSRSKSLSRSRSRSRSRSLAARRRKPNRPLVPTARAAMASGDGLSPSYHRVGKLVPELRTLTKAKPAVATQLTASEKKAVTERALLMNPPPPTPRKPKDARPPSPAMMRKLAQNPPPPSASTQPAKAVGVLKSLDRPKLTVAGAASIKAKMHTHSASSRSSSGSDSSGSSSDSSESSYSSSSSSREPSPKVVRPLKRMVIDDRDRLAFAQSMKIKAMDALKLSGQKQQIKLTLKTPGTLGGAGVAAAVVKKPGTGLPELPELNLVRRERGVATIAGKKRPADDTAMAEQAIAAKMAALSKPAAKKATSRREELLKQLKAVEDAIARKRSKIIP